MVSHRALKVTGFQRVCPLDLVLLLSSSLAYQFHVRHWITSFHLLTVDRSVAHLPTIAKQKMVRISDHRPAHAGDENSERNQCD